jgi:hypothetical protein
MTVLPAPGLSSLLSGGTPSTIAPSAIAPSAIAPSTIAPSTIAARWSPSPADAVEETGDEWYVKGSLGCGSDRGI